MYCGPCSTSSQPAQISLLPDVTTPSSFHVASRSPAAERLQGDEWLIQRGLLPCSYESLVSRRLTVHILCVTARACAFPNWFSSTSIWRNPEEGSLVFQTQQHDDSIQLKRVKMIYLPWLKKQITPQGGGQACDQHLPATVQPVRGTTESWVMLQGYLKEEAHCLDYSRMWSYFN